MLRFSLAPATLATLAALAVATSLPATAGTIPDGCNPAVQNWANGSGYTCPMMGGSAVGTATVAPVIPTTDKEEEEETLGCAAIDLKGQALPPALRNRTASDAIALTAIDPCAE